MGDCPQGSTRLYSSLRELMGPRPLCGVRDTAKLGNWHPSMTDIIISRIVDSHPMRPHLPVGFLDLGYAA